MTTLHHAEDIADDPNQEALEELARAIEWDVGQFALILARCNSASLRSRLMQRLREICSVEIREIVLDKSVKTLYSTIQAEFAEVQPSALMVCGLESVSTLDRLLTGANQVREEFRKNFHFPLVWWVTDEVLQKLIRLAPDLQSWFTTVEFEIATEELTHCIQETADQVFAKVLDAGAGIFLDNAALNLGTGSTPCNELESARHELESRGMRLDSELEASLEFVLGRAADGSMELSRHHLERSLALWQQQSAPLAPQFWGEQNPTPTSSLPPPNVGGDGESKIQNPKSLERIGCVLDSLGLWWRTYAERHRAEYEQACSRAKEYFQQCIAVFEQARRPDLVAKFINALGDILQRLQQWDELEAVAQKALTLYQTYPDPFRLPRAHGFLAEVHLAKSAWTDAKQAAETALSILASTQSPASNAVSSEQSANLDWVRFYHQGWYLFSLARAHSSLGQAQEAIATLETAAAETKPYYDPELYIRILEELRSLYFKQGDYLKAFHIKQDQRSIEQQYGFRAFVGAGRLQPKQEVANPALSGIAMQGTVAQEIAASGRQQDVNRLVERIGRSDHKLTVIQGQSGVGKSSLVQAGLIPALKQNAIGTRDVVPVLQQVYTDWVRELGKCLTEALVESGNLESDQTPQPPPLQGKEESSFPLLVGEGLGERSILDQLKKNAEQNLLTVLIFDQFEEFFFICKDPIQRRQFYEFMRDALDVPYVKVILSLREDYLYYLLECNNRLISLEVINNNILDKHILYYLGNFSVEDAKSVIQNLTELAQFPLETALIDALVQDLAGELGEVRPIELQVVGAQLQTEKIGKLEQYQKHGPKEKLVERFLEEVVKDCGSGNEQIAKLVLYLLTDENNTRPLKTRADLELELDVEASKLDLVLEIFVKSRLVFQVPALPVDRYQLVHDYLVAFVRQQQSARLIAELEKEREQRKLTEAKLNQVLRQQLRAARRATITLTGLLVTIGGVALIATVAGINLYLTNLTTSSAKNQQIEQVVSALKAAKKFKQLSIAAIPGTKFRILAQLNQALSSVTEINRLEGVKGVVKQISFSPTDGKMIATVSEDGTAQVWGSDGSQIPFDERQKVTVTSASFSPESKLLVTASKEGKVIFWRINNKRITYWKTFSVHKSSVTNVSFSPDGKLLAAAGEDKTVKIWSINGKKINTTPVLSDHVTTLSFSPNGKMLATGSQFDTVKLWKIDGKPIGSIDNYGAMSIYFNSDKSITLVNKDGTVKLWRINSSNGTLKGTLLKNTYSRCSRINFNIVSLNHDGNWLAYNPISEEKYLYIDKLGDFGCYGPKGLSSDSITYLSFSPDGKVLASASKDKTVKLWRVDKMFNLSEDGKNSITRVKYSRDGNTVAIGRNDNTVEIRQHDGTLLKTLSADSSILSFSSDGKTLATASIEDVVKLRSPDGREIRLKGHIDNIKSLNFSPDGELIVIASGDNKVQLWRRDGSFFKNLPGHIDSVKSVKFSPDSQIIAAIDANNKVLLWRRDGSVIGTLPGHAKEVTDVVFSSNSQFITSFGDDNVVNLWHRDGKLIKTLIEHTDRVTSVSFSPDSTILASVSSSDSRPENSEIRLWRSKDGNSLRKPIEYYGIQSVSFSHDGRTIASINADNTVKLWSLEGNLLATLKGHYDQINSLSFSLDSKRIATASNDGTVGLWRSDGHRIKFLRGHGDAVYSVSFSRDSKTLASASKDKTVKLWRISDGSVRKLLPVQSEGGTTDDIDNHLVSFSDDGKFITSVSGDWSSGRFRSNYTVTLWSSDGKIAKTLIGRSDYDSVNPGNNWLDAFKKVSFSADGRTVALVTRDHAINLWNLDGTLQPTLKGHNNWVNSVSFSRDGKLIASGSDDGTLKLWRSVDGKFLNTIKAHNNKVNSVSFSHDGKMIASASDDQTVKLWNSNGTPYQPLPSIDGHNEKVTSVRFSPDDKTIAYASESGTVRLRSISDRKDDKQLQKPDNINSITELDSLIFSEDGKRLALGGSQFSNARTMSQLYIPNSLWFEATQLDNSIWFSGVSFNPNNESITVTSNDGKLLLSPSLDELMKQGCGWAQDYLKNNSNVEKSDRKLCDDIPTQK
jgi:WD40 repeat protein